MASADGQIPSSMASTASVPPGDDERLVGRAEDDDDPPGHDSDGEDDGHGDNDGEKGGDSEDGGACVTMAIPSSAMPPSALAASSASSRAGADAGAGLDDDDDDGDKKPAAKSKSKPTSDADEGSSASDADSEDDNDNDDNEESSSNSEDESSSSGGSSSDDHDDDDSEGGERDDDDDDDGFVTVTDEVSGERRRVSAYEALRLQRIRRNRERLASLGLEGGSGSGSHGRDAAAGPTLLSGHAAELERQRAERKEEMRLRREERKRQRMEESERRRRRSSSRKRRAPVSYAEDDARKEHKRRNKSGAVDGGSGGGGRAPGKPTSSGGEQETPVPMPRGGKQQQAQPRVPLFIYREFRRVERQRKQNLKRAKRNARAADAEYRFARRAADRVERTVRKREEQELHRKRGEERRQEKEELREAFRAIYDKKAELVNARDAFDAMRHADGQRRSRNYVDFRRSYADAAVRYPLALREAEVELDMLLLRRCPDDLDLGEGTALYNDDLDNASASSLSGLFGLAELATDGKRKRKKGTKGKKKDKSRSPAGGCDSFAADTGRMAGVDGAPLGVGLATSAADAQPFAAMGASTPASIPAASPGSGAVGTTMADADADAAGELCLPFASPGTAGLLHPDAQRRLYDSQRRAAQGAMARLLTASGSGSAMLPPSNVKKSSKGVIKGDVSGVRDAPDDASSSKDSKKKTDRKSAKGAPDWIKRRMSGTKIRAKNVGGPVPEFYVKSIQRSWLDTDDAFIPSGTKQFVPQTGDLVLYYPRGHKLFLDSHPDYLGRKVKQLWRQPLWERAKKEKEESARKDAEAAMPDAESMPDNGGRDGAKLKSPKKSKRLPKRKKDDEAGSELHELPKDEIGMVKPEEDGEDAAAAAKGDKKKSKAAKNSAPSPQWWNEAWLSSMESDEGGMQPLLCRVESTQAEFPYNKGAVDIATNRKTSWSGHIDRKKKEQIKEELSKKKPMLRLSMTLKPLTSLTVPTWNGSAKDCLAVPPPFTTVCFPSKVETPFVLPFFFTYMQSLSLNPGDRLQVQFDDDMYTGTFQHLVDDSGALEKAIALFPEIFQEDDKMPLDQRLEQLLLLASTDKSATIPFEDVRAVLQYVSYYWHKKRRRKDGSATATGSTKRSGRALTLHNREEEAVVAEGSPARALSYATIIDFISTTLPKWDNAVVQWDDSSVSDVCPWEAVLIDSKEPSATYPGCRPGNIVSTLGGKLLEDLQLSIKNYVDDNSEAAAFVAPIDVKTTPAYTQNVPMTMSIQRILGRLELQALKTVSTRKSGVKVTSHKCCYYRSVAAVISDLNDIAHNCVLYNDPSSEIAKSVRNVVEDLKYIVDSIEITSQRKRRSKDKVDNCGQMLLWQSPFDDTNKMDREPFLAPMRRMWAQEIVPDLSWGKGIYGSRLTSATGIPPVDPTFATAAAAQDSSTSTVAAAPVASTASKDPSSSRTRLDLNSWLPQVGDEVFYSHKEHCTYLRGHFSAFSNKQRTLPSILPPLMHQGLSHPEGPEQDQEQMPSSASITNGSEQIFTGWLVGTIASIKAIFPPPPLEDDSMRTFDDVTPILEISIHFNYPWLTQKTQVVYWRPCKVRGKDPVLKPLKKKIETKQAVRIRIKVNDRDSVSTEPILLPPKVIGSVDGLADALEYAGDEQYNSMNVFVTVNEQKILRKPAVLPPYVIENISGLADVIGSNRREAQPDEQGPEDDIEAPEEQLIGETPHGNCMCCSLDSEVSFLRPAWIEPTKYRVITPMPPVPRCLAPPGIPSVLCSNILRLLEIMKQRCIDGVPVDSLKQEMFDDSTSDAVIRSAKQSSMSLQTLMFNMPLQQRETLAKLHFLPPWFAVNANGEVRDGVRKSDAFLPLPYLCLDLVMHRMKQGYYRNLIAATHDIREAYVATVMYLLSAGDIQSLKKIAVLLVQRQQPASNVAISPQDGDIKSKKKKEKKKKKTSDSSSSAAIIYGVGVTLKEEALFKRIEQVRKLYAAALTCLTHTIVVETAFGKKVEEPSIERVSIEEIITDQRKMATRKKITHLLDLISPDPCQFRSPIRGSLAMNPTVKVKVIFSEAAANGTPGEEGNDVDKDVVWYTAKDNDTPKLIAAMFNVAVSEIVDANRERFPGLFGKSRLKENTRVAIPKVDNDNTEDDSDGAEPVKNEVECDSEEATAVDMTQPLLFESEDYIASGDLVRALFGRESRQEACVRCKKAGRSMFSCRVLRAHSTADFNLDEVLGERGVDGLIEDLLAEKAPNEAGRAAPDAQLSAEGAPGSNADKAASVENGGKEVDKDDNLVAEKEEAKEMDEDAKCVVKEDDDEPMGEKAEDEPQSKENDQSETAQSPSKSAGHALTEAERAAQELAVQEQANEKRALEAFKKVELMMKLSKETLAAAKSSMDKPAALSQEFIKLYFPVDADDGHYEICTTCGLGGDVLCCETCPNVSHTTCVGLKEVPEGDWYCKLCVAKGKGPKDEDKIDAEDRKITEPGNESAEEESPQEGKKSADDTDVSEKAPIKVRRSDDTSGNAVATDEPLGGSTTKKDEQDASVKKVSFAVRPEADSFDALAPTPTPVKLPADEEDEVAFEEKIAQLESIIHELKSLRQKPKPSCPTKEKETGNEADEFVGGAGADDDDGSDDDGSKRKTRGRPPKKPAKRLLEIGTKILKDFEGYGDFEGKIVSVPASEDEGELLYRVRYTDGDEEDMHEDEAHACVEAWVEKNSNSEPEDSTKRKRRKVKRLETVQAAAIFKGKNRQGIELSPTKDRSRGSGLRSPVGAGYPNTYNRCKVEGCKKYHQSKCEGMCAKHFRASKQGEILKISADAPSGRRKRVSGAKSNSNRPRCSVEGCFKYRQQYTDGMCAAHYTESKKNPKKRKTSSRSRSGDESSPSAAASISAEAPDTSDDDEETYTYYPGFVCPDMLFYCSLDDETPKVCASKLGCEVGDLVKINKGTYKGLTSSSKLEEGTILRIPHHSEYTHDLEKLKALCRVEDEDEQEGKGE